MEILLSALLGAVLGWAANQFLPSLWRRITRQPLIHIYVETDPAIIWAGAPPWVGGDYVLPDVRGLGAPPSVFCPDWYNWLRDKGALPAFQTEAEITITAARDLTIVLDGVRARVTHRGQPPTGVHLRCAVGGADIIPRHIRIELETFDPPTTSFIDSDSTLIQAPKFTLSKREAEKWYLVAEAQYQYLEWTVELLAIVNGKRRIFPIDNNGTPFKTCGIEGLPSHVWDGVAWQPPLPT